MINKIKSLLEKDRIFIGKIFFTSLTRGFAALGTTLFNYILARRLGIVEFGDFMFGYSILMGLAVVGKFGMPNAILRFAGIYFSDRCFGKLKSLKKDILTFSYVISIVLSIIFILSRYKLTSHFFEVESMEKVIIIFAITLPFYVNLGLQSSFMKAYQRPEIAPFFEVGLSVFYTSFLVGISPLVGIDITPVTVGFFLFISVVVTLMLGNRILSRIIKRAASYKTIKKEEYRGVFKTLPDYASLSITTFLAKFSPIIILGVYSSSSDVGLYSIANSASFVISFMLLIIDSVTGPYFASFYKNGDLEASRQLIRKSVFYMMIVVVPIVTIFFLFPTKILSIFGTDYIHASKGLQILTVAQLFNVLTGPAYIVLGMTGHEVYLRNIVIGMGIFNVTASTLLVPLWGFMGAITITALGLILMKMMAFQKTQKILYTIDSTDNARKQKKRK